MGENLTISIPADVDGYLLMRCPRCLEYFKVKLDEYESDDVSEMWCCNCGIKSDEYWPGEVIELAKAKALNHFQGEFAKELSKIGKSIHGAPVSVSITSMLEKEREGMIFPDVDQYEDVLCRWCGRHSKVKPLQRFVGPFCAFCGERL